MLASLKLSKEMLGIAKSIATTNLWFPRSSVWVAEVTVALVNVAVVIVVVPVVGASVGALVGAAVWQVAQSAHSAFA